MAPEIIFKNILKLKELESNELTKINVPKQSQSTAVENVNEEQITQMLSKDAMDIMFIKM